MQRARDGLRNASRTTGTKLGIVAGALAVGLASMSDSSFMQALRSSSAGARTPRSSPRRANSADTIGLDSDPISRNKRAASVGTGSRDFGRLENSE